jgi:hypothetical protein
MDMQIRDINFEGVLLEEAELETRKDEIVRSAHLAGDLMKSFGVDTLVPDNNNAVRFAILPYKSAILTDPYRVIFPVVHYTNANPTSGTYSTDANGDLAPIEWEIRYLSLTHFGLGQIRQLPDTGTRLFDIDLIMAPSNCVLGHELRRASNKARWPLNPIVAEKVDREAVEMSRALLVKLADRPEISMFDDLEAIEADLFPTGVK